MLDGPSEALAALARAGFSTLESFFTEQVDAAVFYQRGTSRSVARLELTELGTVYVKRWQRRRPLLPGFMIDGQGRRVLAERRNLERMAGWGLGVPDVLASGGRRRWLGYDRTLLVMAQVSGVPIQQYLEADPEQRVVVFGRLGEYCGRLRSQDVFHPSPSMLHIFVDAGPVISMIDVAELPAHQPRDLERTALVLRDLKASEQESDSFWAGCLGVEVLGVAERRLLEGVTAGADRRQNKRMARKARTAASRPSAS